MNSMGDTARGFFWQGEYSEALKLYKLIHQLSLQQNGGDHPETASALHNLANTFHKQKNFTAAIDSLKEAWEIRKKSLGQEHPITLATLENIVLVLVEQGNMTEAIEYSKPIEEILQTKKLTRKQKTAHPPEDGPDSTRELFKQAKTLTKNADFESALKIYNQIFEIYKTEFGTQENEETIGVQTKMAQLLHTLKKYDESMELYGKAYDGRSKLLGAEHPDTVGALKNMAKVMAVTGNDEEAMRLLHQVYGIQMKTMGVEHKDTKSTLNNLIVLRQRIKE